MLFNKKKSLGILSVSLLIMLLTCSCDVAQTESFPAETASQTTEVKESLSPQVVQDKLLDFINAPCYSESFFAENNIVLKNKIAKNYANDDNTLVINIDADVYMPDAESFPAVKYEFRFFTQNEVDAIVSAFTGGGPLFKSDSNFGEAADTDICSGTQKWLVGTYRLSEQLDARLHIQSDPADGSSRVAMDAIDKKTGEPLIFYSRDWRNYDVSEIAGQPENIELTPEEAVDKADAFFRLLGLDDEVKISRVGLLTTNNVTCYEMIFLRYIDGIPFVYVNTPVSSNLEINFLETPRLPAETMTLYINDSGILKLDWISPMTRIGIAEESVLLKQAEDIADDFISQMSVFHASDKYTSEYDIRLMCLSYGLSRIPGSDNQFLAVPVWDFFGTVLERGSDTANYMGSSIGIVGSLDYSFMTINAVSGELFNRDTGLNGQ